MVVPFLPRERELSTALLPKPLPIVELPQMLPFQPFPPLPKLWPKDEPCELLVFSIALVFVAAPKLPRVVMRA